MQKKSSYLDVSERKLLLKVVDIFVVCISLWLANAYLEFDYVNFNNDNIVKWLIIIAAYLLLFGEIFQSYNLVVSNNRFLIVRSVFLTVLAVTIFYVFTPFVSPSLPENRLQIIYFYLILSLPILLWRYLYMFLLFTPKYFKSILIIGHSSRIEKLLNLIKNDGFHQLITYISDKKAISDEKFTEIKASNINEIVRKNQITEVIISTQGFTDEINKILNEKVISLFEKGVNIKSFETFYEEVTNRIPKEYLSNDFYKNINFSSNNNNRLYLTFHRTIDIVISFVGMLFFLGVIPFVFVGNLIANRGPLFYGQERVGKKGKIFRILKLRSMVTDAEKNGAVWATKNDVRITAFGKFLRNTRLDEIPQFYNILKGEMSIIGPRPERPEFVKNLAQQIPFYKIRHVIKPGLTGWAQVNYPYANTMEEQEIKLRYDLYYIKERNTFLDFKILIQTITTVLFFKGQ